MQIICTNALDIKDINNKIDYVMEFLRENPNIHNMDRVLNWMRMPGLHIKTYLRESIISNSRLFQNTMLNL